MYLKQKRTHMNTHTQNKHSHTCIHNAHTSAHRQTKKLPLAHIQKGNSNHHQTPNTIRIPSQTNHREKQQQKADCYVYSFLNSYRSSPTCNHTD